MKDARILQGNCPQNLSLSIDSRSTKNGDIFCFLETTPHNGYPALEQLLAHQIAGIMITESMATQIVPLLKKLSAHNLFVVVVPQVLQALYELARSVRLDNDHKTIIAISGTGGTKITQEALSNILQHHGQPVLLVHEKEHGILAEIAQSIINTCNTPEIILFEAISHKRNDIKTIADIVRPSYAIINSIGHYNIDTIGSLHDVATEQRDIFSFFTAKNIGVINGDQKELAHISYPYPIIKFGLKISNQIQARKIRMLNSQTHCILKIYKNKYSIVLKNTNTEILSSILSAVAMAKLLMIPDDIIVSMIQQPLHVARCFEIKKIGSGDGSVIDDTCNADPESVKAALIAFQNLESRGPKIIILGDMTGLGISSAFWHRQIGRFLRKVPSAHRLFIIGKYGEYVTKTVPKELNTLIAQEWHELLPYLKEYFVAKPVILIKGGQASGLRHLVNALCNEQ